VSVSNRYQPRVEQIDERNWLLRFGDQISEECAHRVQLAEQLAAAGFAEQLYDAGSSVYHASTELPLPSSDRRQLKIALEALVQEVFDSSLELNEGKLVHLPVYYGREVALDWAEVELQTGLSFERVCELHQRQAYRVYAIGFAPGFAYLGTTPEEIRVQRKSTPRLSVPRGSLALADNQTAIYPAVSPGGWQLIGRSPIKMIDWQSDSLMPLRTGDKVLFEAINKADFLRLGGCLDAA